MSVCLTYPIENGRVSFFKSVIKIFGMKDLTINKNIYSGSKTFIFSKSLMTQMTYDINDTTFFYS